MTPSRAPPLDLPEKLAVFAAVVAILTLVFFGGVLSAIAFLWSGLMGCTRLIEANAARGKPTIGNKGRIVVAAVLVATGIGLFPDATSETKAPEEVSTPAFAKWDAMEVCKKVVLLKAAHPSTVEFPSFDYNFQEYAESKSRLIMSFQARNGFNLTLKYDVACEFTADRMTDFVIVEAGK